MSMHEIEDLVTCSVMVLAAARPSPGDARDICHSLYELQDRFDCGYTVLRVGEELEALGYLRRLPPALLPEPERAEALALGGRDGFLGESPEAYFDAESGLCCVTAGSPLWDKLCAAGVLTGEDCAPVRSLPVLALAERIAELAAGQDDGEAADVMGLWYGLFPAFMLLETDGEKPGPRVLALRDRLAVPQAFAAAQFWRLLPDTGELGDYCDPFEEEWLAPYAAYLREAAAQERKQRIQEAIGRGDYASACLLADAMETKSEQVCYRALASLCYHQNPAAGERPAPFEGLLSPEQVRDAFTSCLGQGPEQDGLCLMSLASCHILLGDFERGYEALRDAFVLTYEQSCGQEEDEWMRRYLAAALAVSFYRVVGGNIPDGAPGKERMLESRAGELPTLPEARDALRALMEERPGEAWACRYQLGVCLLFEGDPGGALRELEEADRLHPGDPEIAQALAQAGGAALPG